MHHCYPSPLHFGGFPKCVTISTNNVVVHGIPDSRPFREGDLVSVDVSIYSNGYHGDTAVTFLLGKDGPIDLNEEASHPDQAATRLLRVGRECLTQAINVCKAGVNLKDVARLIDRICTEAGFSVIPAVCGHSIGEYLHGPPEIVHAPIDLNETEMGWFFSCNFHQF